MRRSFQICFSLLAVITLIAAGATTTSAHQGTVYMKINRAHTARPHGNSNLYYHGGAIEQAAAVYIVWWGDQWSTGFSSGGYSSAQAQSYISNFFGGVGGSRWADTTTQYCSGVGGGTTQCGGAGTHPSNPSGELKGTWTDTSTVPANLTQSDIAAEAAALARHFGGINGNADYMVFTPSGNSQNGFGTSWCAYHSSSGSLSYSYVPYQPDAGAACGMDFVNGNGYFDGFSIVGGHEYAETVTDPYPSSGWLDGHNAEIGDKCAWISGGQGAAGNITLGGKQYAVQSLWSNAFNGGLGGCVLAY